jgi:hypothetical protein
MDIFERKKIMTMSSFFLAFTVLSYVFLSCCCGLQGSLVRDSLEIEDEDEGSIFYANSTRLAAQVSSLLITIFILWQYT